MVYEVILPKLGQTVEESRIVEWMKQEGDAVQSGDVLFTVETDKAVLDVEAKKKGFLRKILAPAGDMRPVLSVVALMTRTADELLEVAEEQGSKRAEGPGSEGAVSQGSEDAKEQISSPLLSRSVVRLFASPRARKYAEDHGVNIALVAGTGPNGRIVEKDVVAYLETQPKATPVAHRLAEHLGVDLHFVTGTGPEGRITKQDVEKQGSKGVEGQESKGVGEQVDLSAFPLPSSPPRSVVAETPMTGIRAIIAQRMHESHQVTAPVSLTIEVDATEFVALREKLKVRLAQELGFNLSYNVLLIRIVARALRQFPEVNAQLVIDTDQPTSQMSSNAVIRQFEDVHVSLAIDTDRGLVVPVVRNADRKGLVEIARDVQGIITRTREGKIMPDELSGGTFTLTNLGMFDIDAFTPIINLPEIAILGVGRIKDRPTVYNGEICIRKLMWMSLTFDHRLVDGGPASRFLQYIKQIIEEPYLLLA
ncbi:MAG: 2-oxo acid dehydrogenase subunit E2 [Anaerolineae bacterium]|nr:2-oxo acid dehydrogenase subunit E2 [Anaerolineae bacterium]